MPSRPSQAYIFHISCRIAAGQGETLDNFQFAGLLCQPDPKTKAARRLPVALLVFLIPAQPDRGKI
jgi:hypothetical protein